MADNGQLQAVEHEANDLSARQFEADRRLEILFETIASKGLAKAAFFVPDREFLDLCKKDDKHWIPFDRDSDLIRPHIEPYWPRMRSGLLEAQWEFIVVGNRARQWFDPWDELRSLKDTVRKAIDDATGEEVSKVVVSGPEKYRRCLVCRGHKRAGMFLLARASILDCPAVEALAKRRGKYSLTSIKRAIDLLDRLNGKELISDTLYWSLRTEHNVACQALIKDQQPLLQGVGTIPPAIC